MPAYTPPSLNIKVTAPGLLGLPSYLDTTIISSTQPFVYPTNSVFDSWCVNRNAPISVPGTYGAYAYSSYELGLLSVTIPGIGNFAGLDNVNWLLNNLKPSANLYSDTINQKLYTGIPYYNVTGVSGDFTYGDVQQAISSLLGQGTPTGVLIGSWDPERVAAIVGRATVDGNGFVPDVTDSFSDNDKIAVVLDTFLDSNNNGVRDNSELSHQPLVITVQSAALGDFVWDDLNGNGIQDEVGTGIAGVTVNLVRDLNGDGDFLDPNEKLATTTTDASGFYKFIGLTPGLSYQVEFVKPVAYISFTTADTTVDTADSDANALGVTPIVILAPGEYNRTIDAGLIKPASLGDYVWVDANNDGQQNDGPASGLNGVTVNLYTGAGVFVSTTVTADKAGQPGYYLFADLIPGDYKVEFVKPAGYVFAQQDQGADGSDSDANPGTGMTIVTTLTSGENDLSWDAGLVKLAALGDRVWIDDNANGVQDGGEVGKAGVTVELYTCLNNAPGALVGTQLTDSTGNYHFTGLLPGDYIVKFIAADGSVLSTANVGNDALDSDAGAGGLTGCYTLAPGETNDTVDAGYYQKASLGDYVWVDANNDGQQNDGPTSGLNGVTVNLYTGAGAFVSSTVTADKAGQPGYYLFADLIPGDYKVEFVKPAGYVFAQQDQGADGSDSDANPGTGMTIVTTLTSGENDLSWDAGLVKLAALGDRVWIDDNANGVQDSGEVGKAGVTVELYTCLNNAPGALVDTQLTDSTGNYHFTGLLPGDYIVKFIAADGSVLSTANVGNDALDSDAGAGGLTGCYTLAPGETNDTVDAGYYQKASLGDYVWVDANNDGQQNDGPASGLNGVTVNLYTGAGAFVSSTVTADKAGQPGYYLFADLIPGDYKVEFVKPAGYVFAQQDQGADGSDSDANPGTGMTIVTTLTSGENDLSWDAGLVKLAALGDRVWIDDNANGVQDGGEVGKAGVTVELYTCLNNVPGTLVGTQLTDSTGNYHFTGLLPGDYIVKFIAADGSVLSTANVGNDALDSDAGAGGLTGCYTLAPGETNDTVDAGYYQKASLGDYVWVDANNDGQQNDGPASGLNGVTVNLYTGAGAFVSSTVTADKAGQPGYYLFADLIPGDYKVEFVKPAGYVFAQQDQGADGSDSDANPGTGMTIVTTLTSGENDLSWDAGLVKLAALGDRVWIDDNANGVQDGGEVGKAGVTVELYTCLNNVPGMLVGTQLTDSTGNYHFTGLLPGDYIVKFIAADGSVLSTANVGNDALDSDAGAGGLTGCYTLAPGETNDTVDAGYYQKASLGDYVWVDANNDGQQNDGPASGLNGVTVNLYTGAGAFVSSTVTADKAGQPGYYLFADLIPGDYKVEFVKPAGYVFAQQDQGADGSDSDANPGTGMTIVTTLTSGENDLSWDAGLVKLAALGDRVWIDDNANGVQDGGEVGKAGVTVELYTCLNNVPGTLVGTQLTDSTGNYHFTGLLPGDYIVKFIAADGSVLSTANVGNDALDSDAGAGGLTGCYTLAPGETNDTVDAGYYEKASLGDYVWVDANNNGQQDDAASNGLNGVTVNLYTGAGVFVSTTVTTDKAGQPGYYLFADLIPGDYKVEFVKPAGYVFAQQDQGADGSDSDANPGTGMTIVTTLTSGENDLSWDAGLVQLKAGIDIEKYVRGEYVDEGAGGGEGLTPGFWKTHSSYGPAPLAGWPETGYGPNDSYETIFGVDVPGSPSLLEALGSGGGGVYALMRHSTAALLNAANGNVDYAYTKAEIIAMTQAALDPGGDISGTKDLFAAQNELGADLSTPAVGGTLVITPDYDADFPTGPMIPVGGTAVFTYVVTNTGEVALSNVLVSDDRIQHLTFLGGDSNGDHQLDVNETWTYSASEMVVASGQYVNTGTVFGTDANTGQTVSDADKAHYITSVLTASLGDRVWLDANANGVQDVGENGLGGVVVKLLDANGGVLATDTTDGDGNYLFDNLVPGDYKLEFVKPAGYAFTQRDIGADASDSDANAAGMTIVTTLTSGEIDLSWDAGLVKLKAGIDIEKTTNGPSNSNPVKPDYDNEDAADGAGVAILTPGSVVTWTYQVTNTGNTTFAKSDIAIVDDNGTPANAADDLSVANGKISYVSGDVGNDNLLSPGEAWLYQATGTVQNLTSTGADSTFNFNGSSSTDGTDGNIRTFTAGSISVHASAFSRDKATGDWSQAWLGSYGGGLGVTDNSEGSGGNNQHTVDNTGGRDNYVLFEFDQNVVVDSAYLGYVVNDSDIQVWIGTRTNAYANHDALLSDADLAALGFTELNSTTLSSARLADFNNGNVSGNVLVIAADTTDKTPEDMFKIQKLTVAQLQSGLYENNATVTAPGAPGDSDLGHYKNPVVPATPKIDIEKTTNGPSNSNPIKPDFDNEDAADGAGVAILTAGSSVTWTYQVSNTGNTTFARSDIAIVDDNGTPSNGADDLSVANGKIKYLSGDVGNDNLLSPGEAWLYQATGTVQNLSTMGAASTFDLNGSSSTNGTDGNVRTFTADSISVHASAFSRDKTTGDWSQAWLGSYGGGLGVTDNSEGSGGNNQHTVDNTGGRDNYVLFEFDQNVVVDSAYLGYVVNDSDIQVWIGTRANAYANHDALLSDADLVALGFTELNSTTLSSARLADFNNGNVSGNVLVIAADTTDKTPEDMFKIQKLTVAQLQSGIYENKATVSAPGALSDSDLGHYKNAALGSLGDRVWFDANANGIQDAGETGLAGVTVKLLSGAGAVLATQQTDGGGNYLFSGLNPGDYKLQVVAPSGYFVSPKDQGGNDAKDSDFDSSTGKTVLKTLNSGENDLSWDAGLFKKASVGDKVWDDMNHNNIQDASEPGIGGVKVSLMDATGKNVLATTTTNSDGNYLFSNLDAGTYVLQFDKTNVQYYQYKQWNNMSTWKWAVKDAGSNDAIDSDVAGDAKVTTSVSKTSAFTLTLGQNDMTRDAGITPIVIDLDGNGIQTLSRANSAGSFDLFGNGSAVQSGWISGGEGFLAVDHNGNGQIDDISELFGGTAKGAGFAQLASYDSNGDGLVNAADSGFADLLIWRDANGNHQTDAGELLTLAEAGVASLDVGHSELPFLDRQGNVHLERSLATMADGRAADMTDVYFNVSANDAAAAGVVLPEFADLLFGGTLVDLSAWRTTDGNEQAAATLSGLSVDGLENAFLADSGVSFEHGAAISGASVPDLPDGLFAAAANDALDSGWLFG
ncbi:SdrD B-like domain-containing protein [Candidatus Accumulibacter sp. ACC003]|uniref:SdrD B-like domain-containing protein n=1 Tax=Candidatus Accumulibacter sp. ACC003 TaxID=2823334 RepID=UPI0025C4DDBF|nr:SdrD B-like domain-containing protein [Candidatus Accumulibacter sp. ACC003]